MDVIFQGKFFNVSESSISKLLPLESLVRAYDSELDRRASMRVIGTKIFFNLRINPPQTDIVATFQSENPQRTGLCLLPSRQGRPILCSSTLSPVLPCGIRPCFSIIQIIFLGLCRIALYFVQLCCSLFGDLGLSFHCALNFSKVCTLKSYKFGLEMSAIS